MWDISETQKQAAVVAVIFLLLSQPVVYKLTNSLTSYANLPTLSAAGPTMFGIVLHAVVAGLLVLALKKWEEQRDK